MLLSTRTPQQRVPRRGNDEQIYQVLKAADRSMSAYEILTALRGSNIKAASQVYRALDRLVAQHRVHRIESLNAFVACRCKQHWSPPGFLICDACGMTIEFDPAPGLGLLQDAAGDFQMRQANIELRGLCHACRPMREQTK